MKRPSVDVYRTLSETVTRTGRGGPAKVISSFAAWLGKIRVLRGRDFFRGSDYPQSSPIGIDELRINMVHHSPDD